MDAERSLQRFGPNKRPSGSVPRLLISQRTKVTLAFKKASGVKLGKLSSISTDAAIANSRKTRSLRSAEVVRNISDFLAKHSALPSKRVPALVSALYDEKIPTGRDRELLGSI